MSDLGDVTLVCDDDERIQAHKLASARILGWEPVSGSGPFVFCLAVSARILGWEPVSGSGPFIFSLAGSAKILGREPVSGSGPFVFRLAGSARILGWEPGSGSGPFVLSRCPSRLSTACSAWVQTGRRQSRDCRVVAKQSGRLSGRC